MKRVLVIEREFGCSGGAVAAKAAQRLGWKLLDQALTEAIAKLAKVDPEDCRRHEEHLDSWLYRLAKVFWRGSYERSLPLQEAQVFDTDRLVYLAQQVIEQAAEMGNCVIVGRGSPYFLRNRADVCSVFLYGPRDLKIQRVMGFVKNQAQAIELVDTDRQGA
ncbi:MAG TPA: cytidylate kinase-like family protein [Candidatus Competibacteraceae bacterium]|nr:cytidylate kinase-like family protein [Candidatus Competibacteraceae bacterium]